MQTKENENSGNKLEKQVLPKKNHVKKQLLIILISRIEN